MTSAFMLALLTDRAFLIDWSFPFPAERVLRKAGIDWSFTGSLAEELVTTNTSVVLLNLVNTKFAFEVMSGFSEDGRIERTLMSNVVDETRESVIVVWSNRGLIYSAFDLKSVFRSRLISLGLTPSTAFAAFMNFLFSPNLGYMDRETHEIASVLTSPSVYSIGIQIRQGDKYLNATYANMNSSYAASIVKRFAGPYFDCAKRIFTINRKRGQRVVYFVITDWVVLREALAVINRPDIILTNLKIGHINYSPDAVEITKASLTENALFALCQYFLLTGNSGFGRLAVARTNHPGNFKVVKKNMALRTCRGGEPSHLGELHI
mmetsp:Transcript_17226/g.28490  ORF Transcript_17226/g.28490 Transcript_17226/m.28490 type:complete len:321 (+) Transcript_17226:87-1049(+)